MAELSQNPLQTQPSTEHNELRIPICKVFTAKHFTKQQKLKLHFASGAGDTSPASVHFLRASQLPSIREQARSLTGGVQRARTPRSGQSSASSPRGLPAPPPMPQPGVCGRGTPSPASARSPRVGLVTPAPVPSAAPGAAHSPAPPGHGRVCRARGLRARG